VGLRITVISGLAAGIDTAPHEATIAAGARPVGVLGTGTNCGYREANRALHDRVAPGACSVDFFGVNGSHGLVSDAIQTVGGVPLGRRSWHSSWPAALSAGFRSGMVAAAGQSLHRRLSARPKGGPPRGRRHGRRRRAQRLSAHWQWA
jgi:hypothetical protein